MIDITHLIDRSEPGSWGRFFAQRDGTRFIADPSGKQLEAETPDDGTDVSGIGAEDFISHHAAATTSTRG